VTINSEVTPYVGYKLAKAIYKINAFIAGTTANDILESIGSDVKPANRFQDSRKELSGESSRVRFLKLCALPDLTYVLDEPPTWYVKTSRTSGHIELRDYFDGSPIYLSIGLGEGVPVSQGTPPIDVNPYIALKPEERLLLLKGTLSVLYKYDIDDDELKELKEYAYFGDSYRPYYEILTEFLLQVPRELRKNLGALMKKSDERRPLGGYMKKTAYIFTRALENGRFTMFDEAHKFLNSLTPRSRSREFVHNLFEKFGIIRVEETLKGPGRRPPISEEGRKKIVNAVMYLTVFYASMSRSVRLRKTTMGEILKRFAEKYSDYFGIKGELGDTFISKVLAEARYRRFRRICLIVNPLVEYPRGREIIEGRSVRTNFVVVEMNGMFYRMLGGNMPLLSLRQILHQHFGSTSFVYEETSKMGVRNKFRLVYGTAALAESIPGEIYPPLLNDAAFYLTNDVRILDLVGSGGIKIYYKTLTPHDRERFVTRVSEAFLPKDELYHMTYEFLRDYLSKNEIQEVEDEERSPPSTGVALVAFFF